MLNVTFNLINTYDVQKVYIDAANPSFISALKMPILKETTELNYTLLNKISEYEISQ